MRCHQSAQSLARNQILTILESVDGFEKNAFVNSNRSGRGKILLILYALAAQMIFTRLRLEW
jgi:hypothetical protein